jgi:hypothetical protein
MLGSEGHHWSGARRIARGGSLALALALTPVGCGSQTIAFQPVRASVAKGAVQPAARYDLDVGASTLGNAEVWSRGASDAYAGKQIFDVELAVRNTSKSSIRLDPSNTKVKLRTQEGRTASLGGPVKLIGSPTFEPDSSSRLGLHFELPPGVQASDVTEFNFEWHVESPVGALDLSTRFLPVPQSVGTGDGYWPASPCVGSAGFSDSDFCHEGDSQTGGTQLIR